MCTTVGRARVDEVQAELETRTRARLVSRVTGRVIGLSPKGSQIVLSEMFAMVSHLYGHLCQQEHNTCLDMSKMYLWDYSYDPMDIEFHDGYLQQRSSPSLGFGVR